ncbi:MAG: fatty acid desaturase [Henriciella sp.]|jgi:omega-6 fatty acid desaturase (delta-12 desaturase)|nr:fatty acid desaturase [Henriciella sp.]
MASTSPSAARESAIQWINKLKSYRAPSLSRSSFELAVTIIPFVAIWAAAVWVSSFSFLLALPICILGGGFLVRMFLIQHDCSHFSFFKSRRANMWTGRVLGVFTLTPFDAWQRSHLIHHGEHGNLDARGVGDIYTLTVDEYNAKTRWGRLMYRLYRSPAVLFGIGPIFIFLFHHRLPIGGMTKGVRYWMSTMLTNVALLAVMIGGTWMLGWLPFLMTYLVMACVAAIGGVWLFYVQHQFETTTWENTEDWQVHDAALYGSSHYVLPPVLRWLTANIGIHHVHHLYSRIPFYHLPKVLKDHPPLAEIQKITLWESFATVKLKLWDVKNKRLVSFRDAKALSAA